jgi:flagellar biosynthetic protein FlhB
MARSRMMADVAGATVVLANPTHVAVALKYEPGGGAPQVVAKGAGHLAARIREKAEENQVPIVRDPLVTRMLYKMCEVGHYIAPDLYDAIAQVLAFVFYLDQLGKAEGTHESPVVHDTQDIPEEYSDDALGLKAHPGADPDFAGAGAGAVAADAGEDDASYVGAGAAADGPVLTRSERRRQERAAGRRRGA